MSNEIEKVATPRGDGRTMASLSPYQVAQPNVNFSYTGRDWFGPLPPIHPIAPPDVAGRTWDYAPGYNLNLRPRPLEAVPFEALRNLAHAYDPVRLIIERRKDQICRVPWTIRLKTEDGAKRQPSAQMRGVIKDVKDFFRHPTPDFSFRTWLRALVEDLLVIDAPSLYCERTPNGDLVALSPTDGTTVKVVIDERGRTPRAFAWDGTPFVWCGETINVENYARAGFKIVGGLVYPPAFQQILHGMPAVNLTTWDLIYKPMNRRTHGVYGLSPCEQILTTVSIAMRRSMSQLEYFREGNQPDAIFALPETWSPDKIEQFQNYWDNVFSGNLANRRKLKFVVGKGDSYQPTKEPPLKTEFDDWLIRIVCFAFSYPPSAFVSLSNRSIAESHERQAEEEGLEPLKAWFADLANEIIEREFSDEIEFVWNEEQEIDAVRQSVVLTRLVDSGIISPNLARAKLGEERDPNPAADQLGIKTATGRVPIGGADLEEESVDALERATPVDELLKSLFADWIELVAPDGAEVPKRLTLSSGHTIMPNGGLARVPTEDDAAELERDGWSRVKRRKS